MDVKKLVIRIFMKFKINKKNCNFELLELCIYYMNENNVLH